jgi:tetratricopeptide (TPR) repeat protein
LEIDPYFADAYNNLGFLLSDLGRLDEAEANLRQALEIKPDYGDAHNNLGNLFKKTKRFAEAKSCYLLALAVSPNSAEVNNNLGNLFAEERDFAKAEACYRHALAIHPDCAEVRWSLGLLLLFLGRFAEGWPLYDVRYSGNWRLAREWQLDLPYPRWMGEDLRGKTIAVWPEQGYGDEIQFVRYLSHLRSLGATRVTLVCKSALKSLFLNSVTDSDQILSEHEVAQLAHHDFWTTSLSLPLYFKTTLETIPSALPYLFANSDKAKLWAEKFSGVQLNIGLVWKGATGHQNDANRSLQGLLSLAPLWSVAGASFVSLQKGVGEEDASAPPSGQPILNLGADIKDFSDTAAIVSQLDLVICVDTAIAHLAAALGKPCWVLLPMFGIDWRWMDKRADSPWYPGVMRLFRQTEAGDWDEVVQRVTVALERLAAEDTDTAIIE